MKHVVHTALAVVFGVFTAQAAIYTDAIDAGGGDMDITQVEVTHDATDINFVLTLDAAGLGLDADKQFAIGFDTVAGGDTAANAWNSQSIMSDGMDFYSGAWNDGAGYWQMNTYNQSAAWAWAEWMEPVAVANTISFSVSRATLGVTGASDSFDFDVYTCWSSGTWTADAVGADAGGANPYDSTVNGVNTYVIPEPATLMLLLMSGGGLAVLRRCHKW